MLVSPKKKEGAKTPAAKNYGLERRSVAFLGQKGPLGALSATKSQTAIARIFLRKGQIERKLCNQKRDLVLQIAE